MSEEQSNFVFNVEYQLIADNWKRWYHWRQFQTERESLDEIIIVMKPMPNFKECHFRIVKIETKQICSVIREFLD